MTVQVNIPDEAVAIVAGQLLPNPDIDVEREKALMALQDAAPLILAAELEKLAEAIWQEHGAGYEEDEDYVSGVDNAIVMMRGRAWQLRGGK